MRGEPLYQLFSISASQDILDSGLIKLIITIFTLHFKLTRFKPIDGNFRGPRRLVNEYEQGQPPPAI